MGRQRQVIDLRIVKNDPSRIIITPWDYGDWILPKASNNWSISDRDEKR